MAIRALGDRDLGHSHVNHRCLRSLREELLHSGLHGGPVLAGKVAALGRVSSTGNVIPSCFPKLPMCLLTTMAGSEEGKSHQYWRHPAQTLQVSNSGIPEHSNRRPLKSAGIIEEALTFLEEGLVGLR